MLSADITATLADSDETVNILACVAYEPPRRKLLVPRSVVPEVLLSVTLAVADTIGIVTTAIHVPFDNVASAVRRISDADDDSAVHAALVRSVRRLTASQYISLSSFMLLAIWLFRCGYVRVIVIPPDCTATTIIDAAPEIADGNVKFTVIPLAVIEHSAVTSVPIVY